MRAAGKAGLVVAGYLGAFLVAAAVVTIHVAATAAPGQPSRGDTLLFLTVFGTAAVVPTSVAVVFLRARRWFWSAFPVAAVVIAASGAAALIDYFSAGSAAPWSSFAVVRILLAPFLSVALLVSGLFAPTRASRLVLLLTSLCEAVVFASVALIWFRPWRPH